MSKEAKELQSYVYVNSMFKKGKVISSEDTEQEKVATFRLEPDAAYTTVSTDRKSTVNLGNYSSASFSVFCSVPCPVDIDQMNEAYQFVSDFCEAKLAEKIKEVKGKS